MNRIHKPFFRDSYYLSFAPACSIDRIFEKSTCFCCEEVSFQIVPTQFFAFSACLSKVRRCLSLTQLEKGGMGEWIVTRSNLKVGYLKTFLKKNF